MSESMLSNNTFLECENESEMDDVDEFDEDVNMNHPALKKMEFTAPKTVKNIDIDKDDQTHKAQDIGNDGAQVDPNAEVNQGQNKSTKMPSKKDVRRKRLDLRVMSIQDIDVPRKLERVNKRVFIHDSPRNNY